MGGGGEQRKRGWDLQGGRWKEGCTKMGGWGRPHCKASQDLQEVRVSQLQSGGTFETEGTAGVRPSEGAVPDL